MLDAATLGNCDPGDWVTSPPSLLGSAIPRVAGLGRDPDPLRWEGWRAKKAVRWGVSERAHWLLRVPHGCKVGT